MRPDKGRKYYAFYWSFLELPDWFRASQVGWFPLCFVLVESVEKLAGGLSRITALLLETMFSDAAMAYSFATTGMRLPIGASTAAQLDAPMAVAPLAAATFAHSIAAMRSGLSDMRVKS